MTISDYDRQEILRRMDDIDKQFGHIVAYVKRLEERVDELEQELGLRGDEESEPCELPTFGG